MIGYEISGFIDRITNECDIDRATLEAIWSNQKNHSVQNRHKSKDVNTNEESKSGCIYEYVKGAKKGEHCGITPKDGKSYCTTHKRFEDDGQKEQKILPTSKRGSKGKSLPKNRSVANPRKNKVDGPVLRMNKTINKIWHPDTSLVFRSRIDKIVIGKAVDGVVNDLSDEDIEKCKEYGFRFVEPVEPVEIEEEIPQPPRHIYMINDGKFWEATVTNCDCVVRYGAIGSEGTSKTRTFENNTLALKEMENKKNKKVNKGYTIVEEETAELSESEQFDDETLTTKAIGLSSDDGDDDDGDDDDDDGDDDELEEEIYTDDE